MEARLLIKSVSSPVAALGALVLSRFVHGRRHSRQIERARAKEDVLRKHLSGEDQIAARLAKRLEVDHDYATLIEALRQGVIRDPRTFAEPEVKDWCGHRFRNLFLQEVERDTSLHHISDSSSPEQQAEKYLRGVGMRDWVWTMPSADEQEAHTTLLFCPGLLTGMLPVLAYEHEFPELERKHAVRVLCSDSHPMRSSSANGADIVAALDKGIGIGSSTKLISEADGVAPESVIALCYSKGMPDMLEFLVDHPDLAKKVRCIFSAAGAIGGSYIAESMYYDTVNQDSFAALEAVYRRWGLPAARLRHLGRLDHYDARGAVESLMPEPRLEFIAKHGKTIDSMNIPIFHITDQALISEVPWYQVPDTKRVSAYDANNDMQLTHEQQMLPIPMATHVMTAHCHHWDLAYGPFPPLYRLGSRNVKMPFARRALLSTIIRFVNETGIVRASDGQAKRREAHPGNGKTDLIQAESETVPA